MFIRYNQLAKYWEYDGSGGVGTGPWIKLQIDYSQIINAPAIPPPFVLPANVVLTDKVNVFTTQPQKISTVYPRIQFDDISQPANTRKFEIVNLAGEIWHHFISDDESAQQSIPLKVKRDDTIHVAGAIYERGRTIPMGTWQDVPFNAGNFFASSGTWAVSAGHVARNRYTLIGKTMTWTVRIQNSVTSGPLNQYMHIYLPGGYTSAEHSGMTRATEMYDGTIDPTRIFPLGGNLITIQKESGVFLPGVLNIAFTVTFEIN